MPSAIHLTGHGRNGKGQLVTRDLGLADDKWEAEELAISFLTDPRDTLEAVFFFDCLRQRACGWLSKGSAELRKAADRGGTVERIG